MPETCLSDGELREFALGLIESSRMDQIASHLETCRSCRDRFQASENSSDQLLDLLKAEFDPIVPSFNALGMLAGFNFTNTIVKKTSTDNVNLNCPHCQNPVEIVLSGETQNFACPVCQSTIKLERDRRHNQLNVNDKVLGRFQLLEIVGQGGFGTVYRAKDQDLGRIVAVKIPRSGRFSSEEDEERFFREARASAKLNHPNIVPIFEVAKEDDIPYIVTEFVEGNTLAQFLRQGRFTFQQTARIVATIARALHHLHEQGIVHRDLKPSNIMLHPDAEDQDKLKPRIMDFGLARHTEGEVTLTADGCMMGTPAYAPPEQLGSTEHEIDARSDVYSMGVVLYEMLTGEVPFRGTLRILINQVHNSDPKPLRNLNDRVPKDLETICLKCLEKAPARRYQSAKQLAIDLEAWIGGVPISARRISIVERAWRWCARNVVVSALVALVFISLLVGITTTSVFAISASKKAEDEFQSRQDAVRALQREEKALDAERLARLQAEQRQEEATSSLYTANLIAMAAYQKQRRWGLMRLKLDQMYDDPNQREYLNWEWSYLDDLCRRRMRILELPDLHTVKFSPSGDAIAVVQPPQVLIVDPQKLEVVLTIECATTLDSDIEWGPDGSLLAVGGKVISIWNSKTGDSVAKFEESLREGVTSYAVDWNPDGSKLVSGSQSKVGLIDIWDIGSGTREKSLLEGDAAEVMTDVAWSPDGELIVSTHVGDPEAPRGEERKVNTVDGQRPGGFYRRTGSKNLEWDAATGQEKKLRYKSGFGYFQTLEWTNPSEKTSRLLLLGDGLEIWYGEGHQLNVEDLTRFGALTSGAWNKENTLVALGNDRHEIVVVDVNTGNPIASHRLHGSAIRGLDWSQSGTLVSTSENWLALIDDSDDPDPEIELSTFHLDLHIHSQVWSPDSRYIAVESNNNRYLYQIGIFKAGDAEAMRRAHLESQNISASRVTIADKFVKRYTNSWGVGGHLTWSPDGKWMATSKNGRDIAVRSSENLKNDKLVKWQIDRGDLPKGSGPTLGKIQWDESGDLIATLNGRGQLLLVQASDGKILLDAKYPGSRVNSLSFSPIDKTLLFASGNKLYAKFPNKENEELFLETHFGEIFAVDWSPSGDKLIVACANKSAIYDIHTREVITEIDPAASKPISCSWHPDGDRIAIGTSGGEIFLVHSITGKNLLTFSKHQSRVLFLDWSPDGKRLLSGSENRTFIWGTLDIRWPIPSQHSRINKAQNLPQSGVNVASIGATKPSLANWLYQHSSEKVALQKPVKFEKGLAFDGNGFLSVTHVDGFHRQVLPQQFTVEFWVAPQANQRGHLLRYEVGNAAVLAVHGDKYEFGVITDRISNGMEWTQVWASQTDFVKFGSLAHVAGTWDGMNAELFVDGVKQRPAVTASHRGSRPEVKLDTNNSPKWTWDRYGWRLSHSCRIAPLFRGLVHSMRFSTDVRYVENFKPPEVLQDDDQTMILYHFDGVNGGVVDDLSGNKMHGKIYKARLVKLESKKRDIENPTSSNIDE